MFIPTFALKGGGSGTYQAHTRDSPSPSPPTPSADTHTVMTYNDAGKCGQNQTLVARIVSTEYDASAIKGSIDRVRSSDLRSSLVANGRVYCRCQSIGDSHRWMVTIRVTFFDVQHDVGVLCFGLGYEILSLGVMLSFP